jgi:hypothetical protein
MRGQLCRATELGCDTVNQAEEKEVRRQTSSYWAARKHGPEERMVEGEEKKGLNNFKKTQAIEFKCEFEFNQPKVMHQHECNK